VQALPGALPAQLVRPKGGRARWVLDALAAQELNVGEWEGSKVRVSGCLVAQRPGFKRPAACAVECKGMHVTSWLPLL
jgi:hypothetical protein